MFYGKFRGKIVENVDPLELGRIVALVPAVSEFPLTWALPCFPFNGSKPVQYAIPPVGSHVWIEFEAGDPNYPIWAGIFFGEGEGAFALAAA